MILILIFILSVIFANIYVWIGVCNAQYNHTMDFLKAISLTEDHLKSINDDHNLKHAIAVMNHAVRAAITDKLNYTQQMQIALAAILHDVDNHELFPDRQDHNYVRFILSQTFPEWSSIVIKMISLVNVSNGNRINQSVPKWYYLLRSADNLEDIGMPGIKRCLERAKTTNGVMFTPNTPRATTIEQLDFICYCRFQNSDPSRSAIDNIYQKIKHYTPDTGNKYIDDVMRDRISDMQMYLLEFGKEGKLPELPS